MTLLVMLLTTVSAWADSSGSCGTNVTYTYSESTHTLTITGNGAMTDYDNADGQPWKNYRTAITSVVIESDVTHIANHAFDGCSNLATVTFAAGSQLTSIGDLAFYYCNNSLNTITIPASVTSIRERAFDSCFFLTSVTIYAPWLTTYGLNAFDSNGSGRKIYVCSDRVDFYKSINQLSAYASAIEAIPDLTVNDAGGTLGKWTTYYNGLADVQVADGTTIYKATYDKSANNVTLTPVDGKTIKMGEAVILKSDANVVLSSAGGGSGDYTGNDLHGVDYATPLTDLGSSTDTYYVLSNKNGNFGFHKYTGTNMPANKAFLRISGDGNALAPSIDLYIDNNATDIENVQCSMFNVQCDNAWYTLDGRKLNAQPTKKGLYIVNGKKVVIK